MRNALWYGSLAIRAITRYDDGNAFLSNWIAAIHRLGWRLDHRLGGNGDVDSKK
ncbi:hypothetical protein Lser_V15G07800 [Lactuca serriola]